MAKKKTSRKSAAGTATKSSSRKTAAGKAAPKSAVKKTARKTARKPAAKKAAPKAAKKSAVKKPARKPVVKKIARKAAAPKSAGKVVKKTAKKAAKKTAVKKTARKTSGSRSAPVSAAAKPVSSRGRLRVNPSLAGVFTTGEYAGVPVCDKPLPLPRYSPYTRKQLEKLRQLLLLDREKAKETLRGLDNMTFNESSSGAERDNPGYSTHLGEHASDFQAAETNINLRAMCDQRLAQVEQALDRIEDGLYGVCVACGSMIGLERLSAKPFAVLCKPCRENFERRRRGP